MNNQEFFNNVATHLLKQNRQAKHRDGTCAYRGLDNTTCAIGSQIPDNIYKGSMEGMGVERLLLCHREVAFLFDGVDLFLMADLQSLHDSNKPHSWRDGLANIAKTFKLNTDVLNAQTV